MQRISSHGYEAYSGIGLTFEKIGMSTCCEAKMNIGYLARSKAFVRSCGMVFNMC